MKLALLLAFFSFSVVAQDYTLHQAENDTFSDYTREQFMDRLGPEASSLLPQYACNGVNEFDFFWPAIRQNEKEDSLKIQLYESSEQFFYKKGLYYKENGKRTKDLSDRFMKYLVPVLEKIEGIPEGQKLLRQLERSHFPLTIVFGGNSFNPSGTLNQNYTGIFEANALSILNHGRMMSGISFAEIGSGGKIYWDPKTKGFEPHVTLAHEMYHAFDGIRGLIDMRSVYGEHYESNLLSEYRAVFFENIVRKATGVPLRTHYGETPEGPGVLDAQGQPIFMPSPCLK